MTSFIVNTSILAVFGESGADRAVAPGSPGIVVELTSVIRALAIRTGSVTPIRALAIRTGSVTPRSNSGPSATMSVTRIENPVWVPAFSRFSRARSASTLLEAV